METPAQTHANYLTIIVVLLACILVLASGLAAA